MLKSKYTICMILLASALTLSQTNAPGTSSQNDCSVALSFDLTKSKKTELQYSFELRNNGSKAVYYSANPQRVGGEFGPYFSIDANDGSTVNIQWRVFHPDIVMRIENGGVNKTGIELKRLEPGRTVREPVSIKWPLEETVPPLMDYRDRRTVDRRNVKRIRFTVGYFEEEEGILEFLTRKRFGWFIKGDESLEIGAFRRKKFHEIQKLVSSEASGPEVKE